MQLHPSSRLRAAVRRWTAKLAVLSLIAGGGVLVFQAPAAAAGTVLLEDDFMQPIVTSAEYRVGGSFTPCLTAAGSGTSTPGRCVGASDPAGQGALRLTSAGTAQAGFLLYDHPLPTKAGLDISFQMYQYGGDGADGISFFLTDGSTTLSQAGPSGGSLGYQFKQATGEPGLANALLGVGFDAYGNFPQESNDPSCPIVPVFSPANPFQFRDSITVRGPAGPGGLSGYCVLGNPVTLPGGIDNTGAATRAAALRSIRIVIDPPSDPSPMVTVYVGGVQRVQVPQPDVLDSTPTFKFGWAASTGGSTNIHEINFLSVQSVDPILPELSLSSSSATTIDAGATATVTMTPSLSAAAGPETEPVTLDLSVPAGMSFGGTPSGTGWVCAAPAGTSTQCTYTPAQRMLPGTTLPAVSVPLITTGSGVFSVTGVVDSSDNDSSLAVRTASTAVTVRPVASAVTGTAVASATAPASVTLQPTASTGTGPFAWAVTTAPNPTKGTATIDASTGEITFTPATGASGRSTFGYSVTGDGVTSQPAAATVDIAPVAPARSATTDHDTNVVISLPSTPVGTGPFTYEIGTAPPVWAGSASINSTTGAITFDPAAGFSGPTSFTYVARDADGIASAPAQVEATVRPASATLSVNVVLDADGDATGSSAAPSPSGDGPFTFALVSQPASGTATIDADTGVVTYTAANGTSGMFTAGYTVTDSNGVTSPTHEVDINVHPSTAPVSGETDAETEVTLAAPQTVGSGPFTYAVVPAPGTSAVIATDGSITFDPLGNSGTFTFSYYVFDIHGVPSPFTAVTIDVKPVVDPLVGHATADPSSPASVDLDASPVGSGPFTYEIAQAPAADVATATATATGVSVTPEPGISGTVTFSYRAIDGSGLASEPVMVTLHVAPVAGTDTLEVRSGEENDLPFPTPVGTGPFTYTIQTGIDPSHGTVTVGADGTLVVDIEDDFSGPDSLTYTVTDADGEVSAPQVLDLVVVPVAKPARIPTVGASTGTPPPVVYKVAEPSGTGPFTFSLVAPLPSSMGDAVIDPATGLLSFTPKPGVSGRVTITYRVTDANGVEGDPVELTLDIRPAGTTTGAPTTGGTTTGTKPVTVTPPTPVGKGPFTFRLVTPLLPSQGTATIDPDTGEITFVAADGFTGTVTLEYEVVDADGIVSTPTPITFEVLAEQGERAPSSEPAGSDEPPPSRPRRLAFTGAEVARNVVAGTMLLLAGAIVVVVENRRRRRTPELSDGLG